MLILLDIDGVMVPAKGWKAPELLSDGFPDFSANSVSGLRKIITATGASILLTTSHKSRYSLPKWRSIFAKRGIDANIAKLRAGKAGISRKDEVLNWIYKHKSDQPFIIIDDDTSLNGLPAPIKQNLILTSPYIGLNESIAEKAIQILHHAAEPIVAK